MYPKKELPFFILFTAGLCSFTALLALLTHQYPEPMGVIAKTVSTYLYLFNSKFCFLLFILNFIHVNYYIQQIAVILYFHFFVGPHLVVHAHQLHFGKTGSHLALKPPPSTVPHLITMATSQIKEFCHVLIGLLKKIMWTFFFKLDSLYIYKYVWLFRNCKTIALYSDFFPQSLLGFYNIFQRNDTESCVKLMDNCFLSYIRVLCGVLW